RHRGRGGGPRRARLSHRAGGERVRDDAPAPARARPPGAPRRRAPPPADRPHARARARRRTRTRAPRAPHRARRPDARRRGRGARRAGGDARRAAARAARPAARLASRDPAPRGERAGARGARPGGRVLGTLDARRAGRLSGAGRLRQALGDAAGGGRAAAVRMPASYALLRSGAVRAAIRTDLIQALAPWLLAARLELPLGTEAIASGRGPAYRVRVGEGAPLVLRICRRGGLAARLLRETYFGLRPRPFHELALTVEARRRRARRRRVARGGRVPRRPEPAEPPRPPRPRGRARGTPRLRPRLARRRSVARARARPEPPPSRTLARQARSRRAARRRRGAPRLPRRLHGPRPAPRPGGRVRLLIVLPGALGDVIRALPLLGRIRRARPDAWLGWAVEPPSAPLLSGHPWLDRLHVFERPRGIRALPPFLQRVRRERYQVALDL